jgi:tRNA 5-methylaminomethyl-2-thiouridine biosynthesis bifunctional protein
MQCFDALIIGSGLAGASCAFALARRGLSTIVCESTPRLCDKASGNRYGLLMPYITMRPSVPHTLYSAGFDFSHRLLSTTLGGTQIFEMCGGIQLPTTKRLQNVLEGDQPLLPPDGITRLSPAEGSARAGIALSSPSFFVPSAGYVSPRRLVEALLERTSPRTIVRTNSRVHTLREVDTLWRTELENGDEITSRNVVVCAAYEAMNLEPTAWLPLEPIRGQTTIVRETEYSRKLSTLLCFDGYLTPSESGEHLLGAHYRHHDQREEASSEDTSEILERCNRWLPHVRFPAPEPAAARVCFRTSTVDRLPYVGSVPDFATMQRESSTYQPGTDLRKKVPLRYRPGLFISAGHGSRGLLSCPLGGELVARHISGEPMQDLEEIAYICHPARVAGRLLL